MAERSSIEVFFKALGHPELQAALKGIAAESDNLGKKFSETNKKMSLGKEVRASFQRAIKDQRFLANEIKRLETLGSKGLLGEKDLADLAKARSEYEQLGKELRKVKQLGKGLLDEGERRDVERLHREWSRLGDTVRSVKNAQAAPIDPNIALAAQVRQQFQRAIKDQRFLQSEIQKLSRQAATSPLGQRELQYLEQLKREYRQLGAIVSSISQRGQGLLDPDELRDVGRLRRSIQGLGEDIEKINLTKVRINFRPLKGDLSDLRRSISSLGRLSFNGVTGSISGISSVTGTLVRNVGGIAPAMRLASGAVGGLRTAFFSVSALVLSTTGAVYGLQRAFGSLNSANQSLNGTVLALRSLNGEIAQANGQPLFRADPNGSGLVDINGGGARQTANDLSFLNQVADEHGISVRDIARSYVQLKAATAETDLNIRSIKRVFDGIADAGTVLGLDQQSQDRALTALQQIASKGTVMAEELKGQLGDALPGTIVDAADAFGVSVQEFLKMVEKGEVKADEFFVRFGDKLQDKYGDAAKSMAGTTRVVAGQLANAWTNAQVAITSGDLDLVFGRILKAATNLLTTLNRNGAFTRFGTSLANSLDPVVKRFEDAVNGGYDFENMLRSLGNGFDFLIRLGEGVFDFFQRVNRAVGIGLSIVRNWVGEFPRVENVLRSAGDAVVDFATVLTTGQFSSNPLANFLASAVLAGAEFAKLMLALGNPSGTVQTFAEGMQYAAYWVGQLAFAFQSIRTGELADALDNTGLGMVENIAKAIVLLYDLQEGAKEFGRVLTDSDYAPQGGNAQANGTAYALRELFTGGEAQQFSGENLDYQGQLEPLFALRDTLFRIGEFLVENRDSLAAFFDGALDTVTALLNIVEGITDALRTIGIEGNLAYLLGGVFVLGKVGGFVAPIIGAFVSIGSAVAGAFAGIGAAVTAAGGGIAGLTTVVGGFVASIAPLVAAIAGAAAVAYTYTRYDNQISGGADRIDTFLFGLQANFAEWTGDLDKASDLRERQKAAEMRYFEAARFDQLSDDFERNRNRDFLNFRNQGLDPAEAARQTEALIQSRVDQGNLAVQMQALNDNLAFGGAQNDNQGLGKPALGQPVIFDLGNGQTIEMLGPNGATNRADYELLAERMRAGRMPAWEGAGR